LEPSSLPFLFARNTKEVEGSTDWKVPHMHNTNKTFSIPCSHNYSYVYCELESIESNLDT
jgi:hypothetical protein